MTKDEQEFLTKQINVICTKLHKKIKHEIVDNFSEKWLQNHGIQILMAILASLSARVLHDFVDAVLDGDKDEVYLELASKISESMILAHTQLRKEEMQ